jgi:hypothetical protein
MLPEREADHSPTSSINTYASPYGQYVKRTAAPDTAHWSLFSNKQNKNFLLCVMKM